MTTTEPLTYTLRIDHQETVAVFHRVTMWRCLHPAGRRLKRAPTWVEAAEHDQALGVSLV